MSSNNIAVRITADVVDLQTKFAVAKAEVNALTSEMNKLAKASASGVIDTAGQARLQQVAGDMLQAKANAQGLAAQLAQASGGLTSVGNSAESAHTGLSGVLRESRALFDELSSGRTKQSPGTVALLASRIYSLSPAAFGAVAGVGALAAGLGYLAATSVQASSALDRIKIGAGLAGNLDLSRAAIKQFVDELSKASNVSSSDARKIADSLARVPGMTEEAFSGLRTIIPTYMQETGEDAEKAAASLAKLFTPSVSASRLVTDLQAVTQFTQAQVNAAAAADRSGDVNTVAAAKLDLFSAALSGGRAELDRHNASMTASVSNWLTYFGAMSDGMTKEEVHTALLRDQNDQTAKAIGLLRTYSAELRSRAQSPEQTLKTGVAAAESENPLSMQIEQAKAKIAEMTAALQVAKERGDQVDVSKLNAGLAQARENISKLQFGPIKKGIEELDDFVRENNNELAQAHARLNLEKAQLDEKYASEARRGMEELTSGWTETYTEITNKTRETHQEGSRLLQQMAKEGAKSWHGMVTEIENVETSLASNLVNRRQTLSQSLLQIGGQLLTREIANDMRAFTTKLLLHNSEKALEEGGLIYHGAVELAKLARTHTSQAGQTAAVTAGNAARTAANTAAQTAAQAQAAATGPAVVMSDAAKAAAGTFASVAQIPYVGWAMAPGAAAAAFATVSAYAPLAAFDVGTNYVPRDMVAQIHEGEAIVPKQYNPAAGGGTLAGGVSHEEHNYFSGDVSISHADLRRMVGGRNAQNQLIKAISTGYRRGARG